MVVVGFCTLLAIPGRPSDQNNQYTKFSHLGLLRCPVFKKIEQFRFKIDFGKGFSRSQTSRQVKTFILLP